MIDKEKRKRVMQRSMALGHCICDPKKSCPCDQFKEQNICHCAGERPEDAPGTVELTKLVEYAGCASKINQKDLKEVLSKLPQISDPRVLVGSGTCDDAGVFMLDDKTALVQTVDVFMPSVDDPYTFGQIAAANSLSDVYAMGGTPLTALSIVGFPVEKASLGALSEMLRGGMDKMREAGVFILGGHSINDPSPKFGFAVTGTVDPSRIVTNSGAKPGDVLVLTKPVGVGVISFASQLGRASAKSVETAGKSMAELNKTACEVMLEIGVNAATDVTGFGLMGHLTEMVCQSGVGAQIFADRVPIFDEVLGYISKEMISGAIERNMEFASAFVNVDNSVDKRLAYALYDPQTSGGLLMSVSEEKADALIEALKTKGIEHAAVIGRIAKSPEPRIAVINSGTEYKETIMEDNKNNCCCSSDCCSDAGASPSESAARFAEFMGAVNSDGEVSLKNKELIAIALSVLAKCEPCVKIHLEKSRAMGISDEEIDEAVWMAISFGGAPTKMFYDTVKGK